MSISQATKMQIYREFELMCRRAYFRRLWCSMTGQRYQLLNLEGAQTQGVGQGRHHGGIQLVPIAKICGSEGRSQDFDAHFCPLTLHNRERWVNIALARRQDVVLPLVELIQIGDSYFVRDGHHRISVARAQGQLEIEAEVTQWRCAAQSVTKEPTRGPSRQQRWLKQLLGGAGQGMISLKTRWAARFAPVAGMIAFYR